MPATYRIYPDVQLVHTTAYGVLRGAEMLAHARTIAADPHFSRTFSQLTDFRRATTFEADGEDIRRLVQANPFDRAARRAALVGSPVAYGMLRMYQILADIEDAGSLVTEDEAEAWAFLGLSPDVLRQPVASAWDSAGAGERA